MHTYRYVDGWMHLWHCCICYIIICNLPRGTTITSIFETTKPMTTTRGQLGIIVLLNGRPLANVYYSSPYVITISALQCSRKLAVIVFGWSLKGREAWHEACRDNQLAWAFNNDQLPFVDLLGSFATETGNHSSQSIVAVQPILTVQSVNSIRTIKSTCLFN